MRTSVATLDNAKGWKVEFDKPLVNGQAVTVEVDVFLGNALEMYPAEIEQKEKQLVSIEIVNCIIYYLNRIKCSSFLLLQNSKASFFLL